MTDKGTVTPNVSGGVHYTYERPLQRLSDKEEVVRIRQLGAALKASLSLFIAASITNDCTKDTAA